MIPSESSKAFCTFTKSRMVTIGKLIAYGFRVSGLIEAGPVVTVFGSLTLTLTRVSELITKNRSVSIGLPAPMIASQYPGAASAGAYLPAACELPV